ncbi:MAG: hypothetical protein NTW21_34725 [Verrucomicrobia bacterium]|nr:hypothetical protein [Verrucomicrobiota bacterium]
MNNSACLSLALLAFAPALTAQSDRITYQGRLERDGVVMNGSVNLRLSIKDAATVGNELYFTAGLQTVNNGQFTAQLGPFAAGVFNGDNRWIEIAVDDPATPALDYITLSPRQPISAAPYAMRATTATTAGTITGTIAGTQITGTLSPSVLASGNVASTLTFSAAGVPFAISNAASPVVTNLNADKLDGFDSAAFLRTTGGTLTGALNLPSPATLNFGNTPRQMVNLYNADYGIGIQTDTFYQRSANDFSWFKGGTHSDARNYAGTGGTELLRLGTDSTLWLAPEQIPAAGHLNRIVIGDVSFGDGQPYVSLSEAQDDVLEITAKRVQISTNSSQAFQGVNFGATTGQKLVLFQNAGDTYGLGVQGSTEYFRSGEQFAWFKDGVHSDTANNAGTGGTTLMTLSGYGELETKGTLAGYGMLNRDNNAQRWVMYARNSGGVGQLALYNNSTGDAAAFSPNGDLYLVGALSTTVLTIRGGADVAEPFPMTPSDGMEPGSVVVIDEENPGKLKLSTTAYDKKVAGIISGAGGVQPGLRLQQDGVMEGDQQVALSGRVYVKADATTGPITPGDLLTTSGTPGHAMRVGHPAAAQGAILGKAMSRLDHSTGLVLVLVTLQ